MEISRPISFFQWLYDPANIVDLNKSENSGLVRVYGNNNAGSGFVSYSPESVINSLSSLKTYQSFIIQSYPGLNYSLTIPSGMQAGAPPSFFIARKNIEIITYFGDNLLLKNSRFDDKVIKIYAINSGGTGFISYNPLSTINSLSSLTTAETYLFQHKSDFSPYIIYKGINDYQITYSQQGLTIFCQLIDHGLTLGQKINFYPITGNTLSDQYVVNNIISSTEFTLLSTNSKTTSGSAIINSQPIMGSCCFYLNQSNGQNIYLDCLDMLESE